MRMACHCVIHLWQQLFESMQKYFSEESIANYAFVYMVQPLTENVPAFCLSCVGTDNKFNAELVLKRWQYIYSELQKRNVHLMSYAADGDSRELKAIQVSTQLLSSSSSTSSSGSFSSLLPCCNKISIPQNWTSWFVVKRPTSIVYIQDMVHLAAKAKVTIVETIYHFTTWELHSWWASFEITSQHLF